MPSGTEVGNSITVESAEIAAHEWKTEELVFIDILDGVCHVFNPRPVVTEPMIGKLL
jgi:hypothetical protein